MKTTMEKFLDAFLNDFTLEEIFEQLDLDVYEVLELAFDEGYIDEELVERLL